jgi:hypothetical protein
MTNNNPPKCYCGSCGVCQTKINDTAKILERKQDHANDRISKLERDAHTYSGKVNVIQTKVNERLAALESEVANLRTELNEVKCDMVIDEISQRPPHNPVPSTAISIPYDDYVLLANSVDFDNVDDYLSYLKIGTTCITFDKPKEEAPEQKPATTVEDVCRSIADDKAYNRVAPFRNIVSDPNKNKVLWSLILPWNPK